MNNWTVPFRGIGFVDLSHAIKILHVQDYWLFYRQMWNFYLRNSVKIIDSFKHWIDLYEIACNKLNDLSNILQSMSDNYVWRRFLN